jgi:hypothetical protein
MLILVQWYYLELNLVSEAIIYNLTGKILRTISAPPDMLLMQKQVGEFILYGTASNLTDCISQGEVTPRQTQLTMIDKSSITANGIDLITITNAPSGTFTATNTATRETVTGPISGTDTFSTAIPGTYKIKIESWPYLDFEAEVVAS